MTAARWARPQAAGCPAASSWWPSSAWPVPSWAWPFPSSTAKAGRNDTVRPADQRREISSRTGGSAPPAHAGRPTGPCSGAVSGHGVRELGAGCHASLPEHLPQVVVDGGRAEEQLRGDVPVAFSLADQAGDLRFLRGEVGFGPGGPLAGAFPGGQQLDAGPFGEGLSAHCLKHVMCDPQLLTRVAAAALAAQ